MQPLHLRLPRSVVPSRCRASGKDLPGLAHCLSGSVASGVLRRQPRTFITSITAFAAIATPVDFADVPRFMVTFATSSCCWCSPRVDNNPKLKSPSAVGDATMQVAVVAGGRHHP